MSKVDAGSKLNTKYVDSYWVKEYPSGIIALMFNTKERWIEWHQQNDECYEFWQEEGDEETIEIPEFLPQDKMYVPTVHQCKDQIVFYYIPFKLMED